MTDGSILACIWKAKLVPMAESTVESTVPVFVDPAGETRIRVLHVDDEPAFPEAAKEFLEKQHCFEVEVAASVDKAVEKMRKKDYDVIVSDYGMPVKFQDR
jgi:Response regulator containing CheY-like receiver, AAA-type ATPase, and DNA-binding domains